GNEVASKPDIDFAIPWKFLALGTVLLVLSFPAYLLLIDPRTLWRTQLLSGIGAGIVLSAAFAVVAMPASKGWNRDSVVTTLSAKVILESLAFATKLHKPSGLLRRSGANHCVRIWSGRQLPHCCQISAISLR